MVSHFTSTMNLYAATRWGNAQSPDGPDGEDTHFLIRAHDFVEAARLADDALRSLPTSSPVSRRPVQGFCHRIIQLGSDSSTNSVPQVLMGPWVAFGYDIHHDSYATWERDPETNEWERTERRG